MQNPAKDLPMPGDVVIASAYDDNDDGFHHMILRAGWQIPGNTEPNYIVFCNGVASNFDNICDAADYWKEITQ